MLSGTGTAFPYAGVLGALMGRAVKLDVVCRGVGVVGAVFAAVDGRPVCGTRRASGGPPSGGFQPWQPVIRVALWALVSAGLSPFRSPSWRGARGSFRLIS